MLASHLLGMVSWTVLSPAVVAFTTVILATVGFALVGAGINEEGSPAQALVMWILEREAGWIDRIWRPDLTFEENALRLFGGLGLLGWAGEVVVGWVRRRPREVPPADARLKRRIVGLAALTAAVMAALLVAVLSIDEWAGDPPLWQRLLQGGVTAAMMGILLFLIAAPPVLGAFFLNEARGPLARLILHGRASSG